MEKRYIVPPGMLEAIQEAWYAPVSRNDDHQHAILEAVIRWWSENPIVPTLEQTEECRHLHRYEFDPLKPLEVYRQVAVEWQRRMFLAKPNPIVAEIRDRLAGRVLSSEDAAELMSLIQMNTRPPAIRR